MGSEIHLKLMKSKYEANCVHLRNRTNKHLLIEYEVDPKRHSEFGYGAVGWELIGGKVNRVDSE